MEQKGLRPKDWNKHFPCLLDFAQETPKLPLKYTKARSAHTFKSQVQLEMVRVFAIK
jgi:hypothetical protein